MIHHIRPILLTLTTLLLMHNGVKAQSAISNTSNLCLCVIYRFDYKLDSAVAIPKSEQMILRINNGASCFRSKPQHVLDSVYTSLSARPEQERIQETLYAQTKTGKTEFRYSIFKEPAKSLVFYHDNINSIDHQYQEKAPLFNWRIMPVKKIVAGYECQQAFTDFGGRTWEAWFTRDIPVSEGPYKFYGLPGLIVKVRDVHDNYVFELLSFESHPKPFTVIPTSAFLSASSSAPLIKKAKFKQAKLNDELTFLDKMASWGNYVSDNMRRDYAAKLNRRNNPLELK